MDAIEELFSNLINVCQYIIFLFDSCQQLYTYSKDQPKLCAVQRNMSQKIFTIHYLLNIENSDNLIYTLNSHNCVTYPPDKQCNDYVAKERNSMINKLKNKVKGIILIILFIFAKISK